MSQDNEDGWRAGCSSPLAWDTFWTIGGKLCRKEADVASRMILQPDIWGATSKKTDSLRDFSSEDSGDSDSLDQSTLHDK